MNVFCYCGNKSIIFLFTQFLEQLLKFLVNFTLLKYVKSQRSYGFLITKELIFGFKILDLKDHFLASLIGLIEGEIELTQFDDNPQINRTNKLAGIMGVVLTLSELDNANNLENGRISNTLRTYHVTTGNDDFTHFEPYAPQYKKLKNGKFTYLTQRVTQMKNKIMTDGPATTVVLHVR